MMVKSTTLHILFFFFQAEDGIRDYKVTGVQTCALPIYHRLLERVGEMHGEYARENIGRAALRCRRDEADRAGRVVLLRLDGSGEGEAQIGRASCRERV